MKSKRSLAEILGVVLGVAAMALVVAALVYLLGARPFHRLRGPWFQTWGSGSGSGAWASEEHTEEVSQRVQKLSVNNVSGPVHVEGWDRDTIEVHYVKQARGQEALEAFRIEIQVEGDTLKVRPVYTPQAFRFGPVSFDLKVPSTLGEINVHSVSGRVEVRNLASDVAQELETVSGSIFTDRSGDLRIKSTSGGLEFSFAGDRLQAKSVSGTINGKIRALGRGGSVDVESVSGSVNLTAFAGLDAELRLQSVSGSISCGFPLQITEKKRNRLEGRIGTGAAPLNAKTVSGSINLSPLE